MWPKDFSNLVVQQWVVICVTFPIITFSIPVKSGFNDDRNFAIVIDAGSSGSRMYVYTWLKDLSKSHGIPNLEILKDKSGSPVIKKVSPGLSEFADKLDNITTYIPQLLDYATEEIPKDSHRSTPLFILATAGMRLLTEEQQANIWNRVQVLVKSSYDFKFENSYAVTITGSQEALYGWIAVNYLTGRFLHGSENLNRKSTYGMLDMGGASMQIAYELDSDEGVPSNLTTSFTLRASKPDLYRKYNVYVVSYLNYGANVIRTRYEQISLHSALKKMHPKPKNSSILINDSCLSRGKEVVQTLVPRDIDDFRIPDKTEHTYQVHFEGTGNFEECTDLIKPLFHKRNDCKPIPCAIGNTVQPVFNTHQTAFFGLTEYNYSMTDILPNEIYSYEEAVRQTKILCAKPWDDYVEYLHKKHPNKTEKEFHDLLEWKKYVCFKAPFVISTLHTGLNFPLDYRNLRVVIDLDDTEVQWNWGALFYILNSEPFVENLRPSIVQIVLGVLGILIVVAIILLVLGLFWRQRLHKTTVSSPSIPDNMEAGIVQADHCQHQFVHQLSEECHQQCEHPNCSRQNEDQPTNPATHQGKQVCTKEDQNQCHQPQTSGSPHHLAHTTTIQSEPKYSLTDREVHNRNIEHDVVLGDDYPNRDILKGTKIHFDHHQYPQ